jgi:hypothetical protein
MGLDVELALHVHDVRRDEEEPAAAVLTGREFPRGRGEGLVLAEDPGGQEGQQHAQLDAGDLAADGAENGSARGAAATFLHLVEQRFEDLPEPRDVRPDPARAVDDEDGSVVEVVAAHPREAADVLLRSLGVSAQLGDDGPGLVATHLWARPYEPGRGRHREIPVDHLRTTDARHASTVRERCRLGQGVGSWGFPCGESAGRVWLIAQFPAPLSGAPLTGRAPACSVAAAGRQC